MKAYMRPENRPPHMKDKTHEEFWQYLIDEIATYESEDKADRELIELCHADPPFFGTGEPSPDRVLGNGWTWVPITRHAWEYALSRKVTSEEAKHIAPGTLHTLDEALGETPLTAEDHKQMDIARRIRACYPR